jgi:hypothetical protein
MDVGSETPAPETGHAGGWVVETTSGRLLHLADLAMLHRWIVERRVGREDRLSRNNEGQLQLRDVAELLPFFEIVDTADRAHGQATPPATPLPAPLAVPVLQPPPAAARTIPGLSESSPSMGAVPAGSTEQDHTVIIRVGPKQSLWLTKLLVAGAVAAVVAYAGIRWQRHWLMPTAATRTVEEAAPLGSVLAKVRETPAPAATPTEGATPSVEPATPGADQPTSDEGAADEKAPSGGSPRPSAVAKARATQRSKAVAAETEEEPLEEVKVEGSTAEPNTPQALAAQGYVALHRQKYIQAIRFFRLALISNPPNGTALFGLAEGYRLSGQHAGALRTYRRYVELMPNGPDGAQARAHLRALENKSH